MNMRIGSFCSCIKSRDGENWNLNEKGTKVYQFDSVASLLIESGFIEDALVHIACDTSKTLSDFFYVPQKRLSYVADVIEVFFEAGMFVELAMIKILQTVPHIRPDLRRFFYIPYYHRPIWYMFYDSEKIMVHPIKINQAVELRTRAR
ncbi:unnamed protein product [Cylicocyclus nassatus]|uniref:Uncharacterized protein n=1 Tax=Cylicocyclus nassatus TaxID=53992 RepID=A0AA36H9J2_CYLNA|nr:unnamed protein product [Cylicocyclus nassatus]